MDNETRYCGNCEYPFNHVPGGHNGEFWCENEECVECHEPIDFYMGPPEEIYMEEDDIDLDDDTDGDSFDDLLDAFHDAVNDFHELIEDYVNQEADTDAISSRTLLLLNAVNALSAWMQLPEEV